MTTSRGDKPRSGKGKYIRQPATAERDAKAARLRADGHTYQQIADQLGFSHRDLARRSVERALAAVVREPAEELRHLELIRLDALWLQAAQVMTTEHITVSQGRVVEGPDGLPIKDDGPTLSAIDRLLKIMERRAKLVGLDAASKVEVISVEDVDREIAKLTAELGGAEAAEAAPVEGAATPEG